MRLTILRKKSYYALGLALAILGVVMLLIVVWRWWVTDVFSSPDIISAINTVTGMAINIETKTPVLANKIGGYSGAGIKPIAIARVYEIAKEVDVPRHRARIVGSTPSNRAIGITIGNISAAAATLAMALVTSAPNTATPTKRSSQPPPWTIGKNRWAK